ncbi:MAG: FkbM family methyltransferase [Saprospiraceae bacterium]
MRIRLIKLLKRIDKGYLLFPNGINNVLKIGEFNLRINELDSGGTAYRSQASYREISNRLYELVENSYHPKVILDIGANYGFSSVVISFKMPHAKVIAVEPSKKLIPHITENFKLNGIKNFDIINAVCGEQVKEEISFSMNPNTSQDNRVIGENNQWTNQTVPSVNIDSLLENIKSDEAVFIKIDTQGYEEKVFKGAEEFLNRHHNWIIKTEFAPYWLKSQGADPFGFLTDLTQQYELAELSESPAYFSTTIDDLFNNPVRRESIRGFIDYVENLNKDKTGWIDLLVRPKKR